MSTRSLLCQGRDVSPDDLDFLFNAFRSALGVPILIVPFIIYSYYRQLWANIGSFGKKSLRNKLEFLIDRPLTWPRPVWFPQFSARLVRNLFRTMTGLMTYKCMFCGSKNYKLFLGNGLNSRPYSRLCNLHSEASIFERCALKQEDGYVHAPGVLPLSKGSSFYFVSLSLQFQGEIWGLSHTRQTFCCWALP